MKNHIRKPLCILLSLLTVLFCLPASMSAYADEPEYFYILGDINADDCVTLKDASVMQRVDVGLEIIAESQYAICDVDGNGKFSLADAYIVQKYALGIIAAYPANQSGYRIGDKVPFDLGSDTDSEDTDSDPIDSNIEFTDVDSNVTETDTNTEATDTAVTETDTDTTATDSAVTDTDTNTEETDTTVTETDTIVLETDTNTEATDSAVTETDTNTNTNTEETDTAVTESDTESDTQVVLIPLEQIRADLNGNFENGDALPDGWQKFWGSMNADLVSGEGVNGSKAVKISHSTQKMSFIVHRVEGLVPGADYKYTVKIKADNVTRKTENGICVDVGSCLNGMYQTAKKEDGSLDRGKGYMMYATENSMDGTFDWKEITVYFVADGLGRADIVLYLDAIGTVWFDDVTIDTADFDNEVTEVKRFEGKHTGIIVYSEDIADLDPADVKAWADDLDFAYEQMADLMGGYPFLGDKCYFQSSTEMMVCQFQALGGINPIKWNRSYMKNATREWCLKGQQTAVPYHEMSHNFDTLYPWSHSLENTADYTAAYAIMQKTEGTIIPVAHPKPIAVTEYMDYLKSVGSSCYDNTLAKRISYTNVNYMDGVTYILCRTSEAVGWDTVKAVYRQFMINYDESYNKNFAKFMYWLMNLQNTYNSTHPDATGYEIYDSFPEGELDYYKQTIVNCSGTQGYDENMDIHCVKFVDPDGNKLWFEFVPHGHAASPKDIPAHEKYGAFVGWDQDVSNVTSDMTVTANYEKYKSAGTLTASSDKFYEGEFVDFTVNPDGAHSYTYNIIAAKDGAKVFESGYTQNSSAKVYISAPGQYVVYAQLKDADGNEYSTSKLYTTAGRAVTIYYSGFNNPNIHYRPENKTWTAVPGVKMTANSDAAGYAYKYVIPITSEGGSAEICFNDGGSNWDNNGEKNYKVSEGGYGIKNGVVTKITG